MESIWPLYTICPFGGILCIECGVPLARNEGSSFVKEVLRHYKQDHPYNPSYDLDLQNRRLIYKHCLLGLETLATCLAKCNQEQLVAILSRYLGNTQLYTYCSHSDCEVLVYRKRNHNSKHQKSCTTFRFGCCTTTWKTNSPIVIPHPMVVADLDKYFCPLFKDLYHAAKQAIVPPGNPPLPPPGLPHAVPVPNQQDQPPAAALPAHLPLASTLKHQFFAQVWQQSQADQATTQSEIITVYGQSEQPNLWLNKVGWADHLQGLRHATLFALMSDDE
jgi:hypothetical protein